MEKQIKRVSNTIGMVVFYALVSLLIWTGYHILYALYHLFVIEDETARILATMLISFIPILFLFFLFVSIGEFLHIVILEAILKRKIPTLYTYEILQENVFLEAKLLIERSNKEMNLQNIVDKLKKRNTDVTHAVLTSLYGQCEKDIDCSICEQKMEVKCGKIISPCACKSIKDYKNS